MQDNIEQDLSEYLQSLNAQRENQADAQREAEIEILSNIFTKEGTNG